MDLDVLMASVKIWGPLGGIIAGLCGLLWRQSAARLEDYKTGLAKSTEAMNAQSEAMKTANENAKETIRLLAEVVRGNADRLSMLEKSEAVSSMRFDATVRQLDGLAKVLDGHPHGGRRQGS